jgi:ubiquinone/menaquinone biosynthesis C-methylase UbiE
MIKIERIPFLLAGAYEKSARMAIESYYRRVAEEIVTHLSQGLLLDLGTGPGYLPIEIARQSPKIRIVGMDLTRRLIEMGRARAAEAHLSHRIWFQAGDAARIPFRDVAFDMVISTGMLHSLKHPVKVIQEMVRVLKTGGEAWIFDPAVVGNALNFSQWKASLNLRERFFFKLFQLTGLHKPAKTYTREAAISLVTQAGCRNFSVEAAGKEIRIKIKKN